MLKRVIDVLLSGMTLLLLAPLLVVVVVLLKMTGEGEVVYVQERVGFRGKRIYLTKFVTMLKNSPNMGTLDITLKNDPRVLPLGKLLRKSKLNELPQVWDVFVGKISLVGWRPLTPKGFANYPQCVQERLMRVKPGLTGIGSLVFRDEEAIIALAQDEGRDLRQCYREDIMPFKGELESWYVDHASLLTDLKIMVATAIAVLRPRWRGFWGWFRGLPKPMSPILKRVLKVEASDE